MAKSELRQVFRLQELLKHILPQNWQLTFVETSNRSISLCRLVAWRVQIPGTFAILATPAASSCYARLTIALAHADLVHAQSRPYPVYLAACEALPSIRAAGQVAADSVETRIMATVSSAYRQQKDPAARRGQTKGSQLQRSDSSSAAATKSAPRRPDRECRPHSEAVLSLSIEAWVLMPLRLHTTAT